MIHVNQLGCSNYHATVNTNKHKTHQIIHTQKKINKRKKKKFAEKKKAVNFFVNQEKSIQQNLPKL